MRLHPTRPNFADQSSLPADLLERADTVAGLARLLETSLDPLVVALDGDWGAGKSFTLRQLQAHLRRQNITSVYFDAFANDFTDDAFSALCFALVEALRELNPADESVGRDVARSFIRTAGAVAVAGTRGFIKHKFGDEVFELIGVAVDAAREDEPDRQSQAIERWVAAHREHAAAVAEFRRLLSHLGNGREPNSTGSSAQRPLVIIVDELDRCRPPFALAILERMKHIFSVNNVHFVLGVKLSQLESSVALIQGTRESARRYLQKFVDVTVYLPVPTVGAAGTYIQHLWDELHVPDAVNGERSQPLFDQQYAKRFLQFVVPRRGTTLRSCEHAVRMLTLCGFMAPQGAWVDGAVLAGIILLKIDAPHLLDQLAMGHIQVEAVKKELHLNEHLEDWVGCTAAGRAWDEIDLLPYNMRLNSTQEIKSLHYILSNIVNSVAVGT